LRLAINIWKVGKEDGLRLMRKHVEVDMDGRTGVSTLKAGIENAGLRVSMKGSE